MTHDIDQQIEDQRLVYMSDTQAGISRKKSGKSYTYYSSKDKKITDETTIKRANGLVLPPAWTDVWIAPKSNSHLQATGKDAAGRKQYRYHKRWTKRRSADKYFNLLEFGKALPKLREKMAADLRKRDLSEEKVLAICATVLDKTLIRIGNDSYQKLYGSHGLTTLRDKHVKIHGSKMTLHFKGKKGVEQELEITDKRLTKLVKKCKEIPGQTLFQYYADGKEKSSVSSQQLNDYIKEGTGGEFTAKDFRTWGGTLEALRQFAICSINTEEELTSKKMIVKVLDCVARKLGNTRAVTKSSYVYPLLLEAYEEGNLAKYIKRINHNHEEDATDLAEDEQVLMDFLKSSLDSFSTVLH